MGKCKNCGGIVYFDPKSKSNVCEMCGDAQNVKYNHVFVKKPLEQNVSLEVDPLANETRQLKCKSCGANIIINKLQATNKCMYCGSETIVASKSKNLMYIDSVVPFTFGKADAINMFKKENFKRFYTNKKVFKGITQENVMGLYVNTFVFDFDSSTIYDGVLTYEKTVKDSDGTTRTKTIRKVVSGSIDKDFRNLTIEANSNLNQAELAEIMPFDYLSAVDFKTDFINGYVLEYQDKLFNDCVATAKSMMKREIENAILSKHGCTGVVSLTVNTDYNNAKYNYCLLPVYLFTTTYKDKRYKALMNGQTGKVGSLPKNGWAIFFTVLLVCGLLAGIFLLIYFLT